MDFVFSFEVTPEFMEQLNRLLEIILLLAIYCHHGKVFHVKGRL